MSIRLLDRAVSELIAAGEVIERPASVVKELVENAMDAGADEISVSLQGGGVQSICVRDNGCGIPFSEVPTAFCRHATSKIQTAKDLDAISTMGFRGEALASIAAVSKIRMTTCTEDAETGCLFTMEGGQDPLAEEIGCPKGTEIRVEQLFYNTPARLKFLKTDVSEGNAVTSYIEKLAVSRPDISFTLTREGRPWLHTSGDGDLKACLWSVYGKAFASALLPLEAKENSISVHGFVTEPKAAKSRRAMQLFFVNGRFFQSRACQAVVEQAMKGSLVSGLHPGCVVFIELPAFLVDVNVHPAKLEVRFAEERAVYRVIYMAVKQALADAQTDPFAAYRVGEQKPAFRAEEKPDAEQTRQVMEAYDYREKPKDPFDSAAFYVEKLRQQMRLDAQNEQQLQVRQTDAEQPEASDFVVHRAETAACFAPSFEQKSDPRSEQEPQTLLQQEEPVPAEPAQPAPSDAGPEEAEPPAPLQDDIAFRYIGAYAKTYLLAELDGALMVVDQHAAHEKMLFEGLKARRVNESQMLLAPLTLELSAMEKEALLRQSDRLEELGFSVEEFGPTSVIARQIPAVLKPEKAEGALREMAEHLADTGSGALSASALEWVYHSVACRGAVKAGDVLTQAEAEKIIGTVLNDPAIRHCPHGRPVYFLMELGEMEKRFGRVL